MRSRRAWQLAASFAAAVLLLGVIMASWQGGSPAPVAAEMPADPAAPVPAAMREPDDDPGSPPATTEAADSRPDVARLFALDAAGRLVIDADTGMALEALIGDMPEQPSPLDVRRTEDALRKGLPAREAARAIGLLRSYRAYVAEVESQVAPGGIPQSLDEVDALFDRMTALRLRHFDRATAEALFGTHDAYARYTMQTTFIEQDGSLSGPVKQDRLDRLRAQLPEEVKAMIPLLSPEMEQVEREVARMRREGATDEQVEAFRHRQALPRPGG
jgi:lipase chaperone LimK